MKVTVLIVLYTERLV